MISRLQETERLFRAIVPTPYPPALRAGGCSLSLPQGQKILSGKFQKGVRVQDKKKKAFPFIELCMFKTNTVIHLGSEWRLCLDFSWSRHFLLCCHYKQGSHLNHLQFI